MTRIVPAYRWPAPNDALWNEWIFGGEKGDIIIINPSSGPGDFGSSTYSTIVESAQQAGKVVIGYVPLGYGKRDPASEVVPDMEKYLQWYKVDGWFLDEAPNQEQLRRYVALIGRWCLVGREGRRPKTVVFNPGAHIWPGLVAEVPGSIWITTEGPFTTYGDIGAQPMIHRSRQGAIIHSVPRAGAGLTADEVERTIGYSFDYGFATHDTLPNPFDGEP